MSPAPSSWPAYMGSFIPTPLYLQNVLGFTETRTGLISISRPLAPLAGSVTVSVDDHDLGIAVGGVVAARWIAETGASRAAPGSAAKPGPDAKPGPPLATPVSRS